MLYEYMVQTVGTSALDNLKKVGEKLQQALNKPDVEAYAELGWELWQVLTLNDASGNNGLLLVYRKPTVIHET